MATAAKEEMGVLEVEQGFAIADPTKIDRLEGKVSDIEWKLRCEP